MKFDRAFIMSYIQEEMPSEITSEQLALLKSKIEQVYNYLDDEVIRYQKKQDDNLIMDKLWAQFMEDSHQERHYQETFLPSVQHLEQEVKDHDKVCAKAQELIFAKKQQLTQIESDRFTSATHSVMSGLGRRGHVIRAEDISMMANFGVRSQKSASEQALLQEVAELEKEYQPLHERRKELARLRGSRDREAELHKERQRRISSSQWHLQWYRNNENVHQNAISVLTPDNRQALEQALKAAHSKQVEEKALVSKFAITQSWLESAGSLDAKKALLTLQKAFKAESIQAELASVQELMNVSAASKKCSEREIERITQELALLPEEDSTISANKVWTGRLHTLESGINYLWWGTLSAMVILTGVTIAVPTLPLVVSALSAVLGLFITHGCWQMAHDTRTTRQHSEEQSEQNLTKRFRTLESRRKTFMHVKDEKQNEISDLQVKHAELTVELAELDNKYQQLEQALVIDTPALSAVSNDSAIQSYHNQRNLSFFSCSSEEEVSDLEQTAALSPLSHH